VMTNRWQNASTVAAHACVAGKQAMHRTPCAHTAANQTWSTWEGNRWRIRPARSSGMSGHDVPVVSAISVDPTLQIRSGKRAAVSEDTHCDDKPAAKRQHCGGARLHRWQTVNASNTLRARPAARARRAEGVGTVERRVRGEGLFADYRNSTTTEG
jgi:hypothetical protein